jgi:uncharacterized protein YjiS (DUF1127 family)
MSSNISNPSFLGKRAAQSSFRTAVQKEAVRLNALLEGFRAWRAVRAAEAQLYGFSDLELRDIGLNRQNIRAAVRGVAA